MFYVQYHTYSTMCIFLSHMNEVKISFPSFVFEMTRLDTDFYLAIDRVSYEVKK
jgi:hypothetical protein